MADDTKNDSVETTCEFCENKSANVLMAECMECGKTLCPNCSVTCTKCDAVFCKDHEGCHDCDADDIDEEEDDEDYDDLDDDEDDDLDDDLDLDDIDEEDEDDEDDDDDAD